MNENEILIFSVEKFSEVLASIRCWATLKQVALKQEL